MQVNGYACHNCSEVAEAKKGIDPAHPKSGPYGVNAADDPTRKDAVSFGGLLAKLNDSSSCDGGAATAAQACGSIVNVCA